MSIPTENSTFKLTYFNVKALAEPTRYLFAYGGQQYEDVRIDHGEDWPKIKPSKYAGQRLCLCTLFSHK